MKSRDWRIYGSPFDFHAVQTRKNADMTLDQEK